MSPRDVPDLEEREQALDPERSFIVQAPAGSGKTELLIQRFLVLLARVARPEEIAAITFTRKAAAEMRARVFEALAAARGGPRPGSRHEARTWELARAALERNDARGWALEENAARLRIQTIDALSASLTRQMPVLSRFGAQPESIEDASDLYLEAARNTLAALEIPGDPAAADVARLLDHVDNHAGTAEALLATMLRQRDHWVRALRDTPDRLALEAAIAELRRDAVLRARAAFPRGAGVALPLDDEVESWIAFAGELVTKKRAWRASVPQALQADAALLDRLLTLRALPPARYTDAQWEALGAITRLLPRLVAELKVVFVARGQADFTEIGQGALRALESESGPTDLLLALDYRIHHVLVDEFQDTSFTQFELLEKLTAGWERGDGRTLFVVGDPMQSIYRFREAEVSLFLRARRAGIGGVALEPLALSANFRSQADLVDWVNRSFARIMPAEEEVATGAVSYSPSQAVRPGEPEAVRVHPFLDGDAAAEAGKVAALVREALLEGAGDKGGVAVLVRNRTHLSEIVPRLKAEGIAFRAIEIEPLVHRPVVQDLLALTRALTHLADRTAWLAVLRAPWCGLTLADLHALAGTDSPLRPEGARDFRPPETVWEAMNDADRLARLSADGQARLARAHAALHERLRHRRRTSLREAVEGLWHALGGPACVADATDLEDAESYLDHLEAHEAGGALADVAAFEKGMARLFALPDVAATDAVQVMTIHKAKGLEFDTVIVPGLGSGSARDERKLLLWMETASRRGLLLAPVRSAGGEPDPIYEYIRALDKAKGDHENGRLLYVAATRARRRLHLLGAAKLDAEGRIKPARGSLLEKLWPVAAAAFGSVTRTGAREAPAGTAAAAGMLVRARGEIRIEAPPPVRWTASAQAGSAEPIEFSWVGETARHVGSVVHGWLQRMAEDELRGWSAARIASAERAIRTALASRGVAAADLEAGTRRVVAALTACIGDARGRWLLGPQRDARSEHRITALVGGERRVLVIDRIFTDESGARRLVDYKTSSHEGGDPEAFLAEEERRYRPQLERYASVVAPGSPILLGLYFPLLGGWREWTSGSTPAAVEKALAPLPRGQLSLAFGESSDSRVE